MAEACNSREPHGKPEETRWGLATSATPIPLRAALPPLQFLYGVFTTPNSVKLRADILLRHSQKDGGKREGGLEDCREA